MGSPDFAIIGAGMAGLACGRDLVARGITVRLFDKGRAPGGRVATRRVTTAQGAVLQFDHGAQYATARDPGFEASLRAAGATTWPDAGRFVGVPGMSACAQAIGAGLPISPSRHVVSIEGRPGAWSVLHADAARVRPGEPVPQGVPTECDGPFDAILITVPAPQAVPLLRDRLPATTLARVAAVRFAPCWTVLAAFEQRLDLPHCIRPRDGGTLGWAARDSSKPGRDPAAECWVIQAGPGWSRSHLEDVPENVIPALLAALAEPTGRHLPTPRFAAAHRWRFALVESPLGQPCLWDVERRIGLAGDWCLHGRVESAFLSGRALASAMPG
jgi:hypothetical protein